MMTSHRRAIFLLLLLVVLTTYWWQQKAPNAERLELSLIHDEANIFTEEEKQAVSSYHQVMLEKFDIDYRVLTWDQNTDIDWQAYTVFNNNDIGSQSQQHRGLLLVINTANDEIRLEVSANLESVFTDAFVGYVEKRQMVPFFRLGRVGDGVFATSELIRIRAQEAENGEEFDVTRWIGSIGGGAKTEAKIDAGRDRSFVDRKSEVLAADTPEETLSRLFFAMKNRNGRSDLDIYTEETRDFMAGMVVSPGQMDNVVKRYAKCEPDRVVYSENGQHAVFLHKLSDRACDPFTFDKGTDGKWRLNLKAVGNGLGHTFGNVWYLHYGRQQESGLHKYYFGFKDYYFSRPGGEEFDHQGFPYYYRWGANISHVFKGSRIYKIHGDDSYAAKIGLRAGDIIVRWEGMEYPHSEVVGKRMADVREGLDVDIVIERNGELRHLLVKAPARPKKKEKYRWGVSIRSEGPELVLVNYVTPRSQADRLGIKAGDFILQWNDLHRPSMRNIYKSMRLAKPGDRVSVDVIRGSEKITLEGTADKLRVMAKVQ